MTDNKPLNALTSIIPGLKKKKQGGSGKNETAGTEVWRNQQANNLQVASSTRNVSSYGKR
eukprot:CAMPEP_0113556476 /NCGR_PEP_ID=MMETSP0015_2-20120614/17275_1 /TAXON_ID=2838 /ORGANISM="Odontella" /LENGTH=59 /DNA_ID=CAMNT_0000457831 /DNA_START=122 /DNA_END=301 /DNA_ORIENTATION=+ /assembly_acc=CAM_ASM_000160